MSDFDGLHLCEDCGDAYTTGRYCRSCADQRAIDAGGDVPTMALPACPVCGSFDIEYDGVDDGGGEFGDAVCDSWHCETCGQEWEIGCFGSGDDDDSSSSDSLPPEAWGSTTLTDDIPF